MNLISLNSIIESTKHNKNTILKVADILNIKFVTLSNKSKYKYYSVEDKDKIISFINEHSPIKTYFSKLNTHSEFGEYKTLTDFRKLIEWDRSKVLICMNHLNISHIGVKGQTKIYTNEDYIKYKTFIENKIKEFSSLKNVYTKGYFCKELNINYEKFDTLCKYNNIKPIFDWEFGKDSKYYSQHDFDVLSNLINESKLESEKRYSIHELCDIFKKEDSTITKVITKLNIPYFISISREYLIDDKGFVELQDYFSTTELQGISYKEKEIVDFIKSIYNGEIIENDKKILNGKELDIYIPSKNVAIEFDSLFWHGTENIISHNIQITKEIRDYYKNKQLEKTLLCEEKGIRLIHIFEDEWVNHSDICKSIIASSLGIYDRKIFARKCEIKEISVYEWKKILNENHIQGYCKANYRFGLYYNNELVQGIGITESNHKNGELELNRMITIKNTQVLGGFSKLVKYAKNKLHINDLYSYISRRMFDGKGYFSVGFEIVKINLPTYFYTKKVKRYPRYDFMKNKIKRKFDKGELYYWNENETEEMNMIKNKYGRIYDCGTIKVKF